MKFTVAYYLLLLYTSVMLKPLLPILSDMYSHTFAEAIHITTVHAKYGSNHLSYDLANTNTNDSSKNQTIPSLENLFSFHIFLSDDKEDFLSKTNGSPFCIFKILKLPKTLISKRTPPPWFA